MASWPCFRNPAPSVWPTVPEPNIPIFMSSEMRRMEAGMRRNDFAAAQDNANHRGTETPRHGETKSKPKPEGTDVTEVTRRVKAPGYRRRSGLGLTQPNATYTAAAAD